MKFSKLVIQYWSVFSGILGKSGQYLVSILWKSGQYSGQYTDFFFTDHSIHHCKNSALRTLLLSPLGFAWNPLGSALLYVCALSFICIKKKKSVNLCTNLHFCAWCNRVRQKLIKFSESSTLYASVCWWQIWSSCSPSWWKLSSKSRGS